MVKVLAYSHIVPLAAVAEAEPTEQDMKMMQFYVMLCYVMLCS